MKAKKKIWIIQCNCSHCPDNCPFINETEWGDICNLDTNGRHSGYGKFWGKKIKITIEEIGGSK